MIMVGTCGFQYREWVTVFYPKTLHPDSWLQFYSRNFECCEIGFTQFRLPETSATQQIAEESRGAVRFVFRAHAKLAAVHPDNSDLIRRFLSGLWPLKEAGQLLGILAQFPPEFEFIRDNFSRLCAFRDSLDGIPLIAEFGCAEWNTPRAAKNLRSVNIALACVDGGTSLREKPFLCATAEQAYIRFQGRNQSRWLKGDGSAQHDYLYSRAELAALVPEIKKLEPECERVLVFMNNPWRGQAVMNARMMMELLED